MNSYRLSVVLMLAVAILAVAPLLAAALRNPEPVVLTYDQFARTW